MLVHLGFAETSLGVISYVLGVLWDIYKSWVYILPLAMTKLIFLFFSLPTNMFMAYLA